MESFKMEGGKQKTKRSKDERKLEAGRDGEA
jgi:hypothetical protein